MNIKKTPHESFADKVLDRIEGEHVTPLSRTRFVAKDVLFWVLWVVSVLVGAMAVAASIFVLMNAGWRFYSATHANFITFLIDALPLFWLLAILLFILFAYENLRHTKHGYRFSLPLILLMSLPAILFFGICLFSIGLGKLMDDGIGRHVPFHQPVLIQQERLWMNPERGLLAGQVGTIDFAEQTFELTSFDGVVWQVSSQDLLAPDVRALARFPSVRIVGRSSEEGVFHACFILPGKGDEEEESRGIVLCDELCERNLPKERSTECRGLRLYEKLERLQMSP